MICELVTGSGSGVGCGPGAAREKTAGASATATATPWQGRRVVDGGDVGMNESGHRPRPVL